MDGVGLYISFDKKKVFYEIRKDLKGVWLWLLLLLLLLLVTSMLLLRSKHPTKTYNITLTVVVTLTSFLSHHSRAGRELASLYS